MLRPLFGESFSPRRGHRRSYKGGRRPHIPQPGLHQKYVALPFILRPTDSSVSTHVRWTGAFTAMYLGQILYVVNSLDQPNSRAFGRTNQKKLQVFRSANSFGGDLEDSRGERCRKKIKIEVGRNRKLSYLCFHSSCARSHHCASNYFVAQTLRFPVPFMCNRTLLFAFF